MQSVLLYARLGIEFQCSSASRKFLNHEHHRAPHRPNHTGFSALQRAENSSMLQALVAQILALVFQCSSASRKFLNTVAITAATEAATAFQCSSASRKFLNRARHRHRSGDDPGFSALQRAENSSIRISSAWLRTDRYVSVLFSEPKIPQSPPPRHAVARRFRVSVLFSEPKIPQYQTSVYM